MISKNSFPLRQVHLDFQTSPYLPDIGKDFDEDDFVEKMKSNHINSITVFGKCHHGLCYYPTSVGTQHPNLKDDFTGKMINAAHKAGIRAPIYITAGWSDLDATEHPEWISRDENGEYTTISYDVNASPNQPKPYLSWRYMCLNDGSYCQHIYDITEEICKRYEKLDGLFFDICFLSGACYCDECIAGMKAEGFDPSNPDDAYSYYRIKHIAFIKKCGDILKKYHPDATIFFNSGGADPYRPEFHPYETHFELEDLPTVWGGYDKLPIRAKYFASTDKPTIGMTGKFHLDWGEFGGFKTKEALRYEAVAMVMNGVGCSIGDQLLPGGSLDDQTYENIGYAYSYIEKIEPYIHGNSTAAIGMLFSSDRDENEGLCCILSEKQIDFDLITNGDFENYKTVIITEYCNLSKDDTVKICEYIKKGGSVIAIGSVLKTYPEIADALNVRYIGKSEFDCDYIKVTGKTEFDIPKTQLLMYLTGEIIESDSAETLAEIYNPYFSRTYGHFSGHKNTPFDLSSTKRPAILKCKNSIVFAHNIPKMYQEYGCVAHKRIFLDSLLRVFEPVYSVSLGSQGRSVLIKQSKDNRYALNVTYVSPVRRGCAEIIEDIPTICNVSISVKSPETIKSVYLPLKNQSVPFTQKDGICEFVIPSLNLHETVLLNF